MTEKLDYLRERFPDAAFEFWLFKYPEIQKDTRFRQESGQTDQPDHTGQAALKPRVGVSGFQPRWSP